MLIPKNYILQSYCNLQHNQINIYITILGSVFLNKKDTPGRVFGRITNSYMYPYTFK